MCFFYDFFEIFKNTFFTENPQMDAYVWFSIFLLLFRKLKKPKTNEIEKISRFLLHEISIFQHQN